MRQQAVLVAFANPAGEHLRSAAIEIRWEKRALQELRSLPENDRVRVFTAVDGLRADPIAGRPLAAEWKGLRRRRAGS